MQRTINNRECELYGTKYCALLNMRSCEQCPLTSPHSEMTAESTVKDLDLYLSLLPEEGIAHLFESETCAFCKGKPNRKAGYALFHMAHPEPKRMQSGLLFGKKRSPIGTLIPVQLGICKECRRKLLILDYLPVAIPAIVAAIELGLFLVDSIEAPLVAIAPYVPFAIWAGSIVLSIIVSLILRAVLKKRYLVDTCVNIDEHPTIRKLMLNGWFIVPKQDRVRLIHSKTRIGTGIGTAPSSAYKED